MTIGGGTLNAGTVTATLALNTGTLTTIAAGTQNTLGTVGVVNNIVTGTIAQAVIFGYNGTTNIAVKTDSPGNLYTLGTVSLTSSGTILNLATGTIASLPAVSLNSSGTILNLASGTLAAVTTVTTLSNLTNGSVNILTGTLQSSGTTTGVGVVTSITNLVGGTLFAGTTVVTAGTLSPIPTIGQSTFGTFGTTGVTLVGTIAGGTSSGAGTEIFITSLSLSIPATAGSQDVSVGWGTAAGTFHSGTASLVRGMFLAGGGIQKTFSPAINSGTNAQLCYFQAGAGTVDVNVTYFITPSTL